VPQAPTSAPKVAETVNKQAAQPAVQAAQPAVHAAQSAQQTAAKAAQPVKQTVDQATKQANATVTAVSHGVEQTVQAAVATAPAPVPTPPSLPDAPQIPALSPVVDTVTGVVTQAVAPITAVVDETEQPEADSAPPPLAAPVAQSPIRLAVAAKPANVAPAISVVTDEPVPPSAATLEADEPLLETTSDDASSQSEAPTTIRFTELNATASFPQPALAAEASVVDAPSAPAEDAPRADVDGFEPLVAIDTTHWATHASPTSVPMAPVTTTLPGSIGLPNSAAAGQVPSLTALTAADTFRGVWHHARRLPSVIVLPNLAPPG
jgi:hypothetical protein